MELIKDVKAEVHPENLCSNCNTHFTKTKGIVVFDDCYYACFDCIEDAWYLTMNTPETESLKQ